MPSFTPRLPLGAGLDPHLDLELELELELGLELEPSSNPTLMLS